MQEKETESLAYSEDEINALIEENRQFKQKEKEQLKINNERFIDSLINKGTLIPRLKNQAVELLNYATDFDNGEELCFSEGESLSQKIQALLNEQPQVICFEEVATKENAIGGEIVDIVKYSEDTPPEMIELDQQIRTYMQQNNTDYTTAFEIITKKGK